MTVSHRFVVVSGIPGCGKSTIGRALANCLGIFYLDKDEILESYFVENECVDEQTRHRLSRMADQDFQATALKYPIAVLDSFWRHPASETTSGTPSAWLTDPGIHAVEVFCQCSPELAAGRFLKRARHAGHLDCTWSYASLLTQSQMLLHALPLDIGSLIEIDTTQTIDIEQLASQVRSGLYVCLAHNRQLIEHNKREYKTESLLKGKFMEIDNFWQIIDLGKNSEQPENNLKHELESLSADEIASFQVHFDTVFDRAYRWDLWGAAYLIHGGCSDDGFIDFRYALISKGKELFQRALENPDSLAELGDDVETIDNESFGYVALEVYEKKTGEDIPRTQSMTSDDPIGDEWDFDDEAENQKRLPKLFTVLSD